MSRNDMIDISCTIVRDEDTDMAILVDDGEVEVWLPRSQIEYTAPDQKGITVVSLPEWLAEDRGLL